MTVLSTEEAMAAVKAAIIDVAPDVVDELPAVEPGADVWDDLDLDSMDHQNVMVGLFERTGVDIPERDYARLRSLDALARYLTEARR